jgi:hypothetical protein
MRKGLTLTALIASTIIVTSCASLTPPVRPDYTGSDSVDIADPAQFIGKWVVRDLNPYPDAPHQNTIIEYLADGTVVGLIESQGDSADALGNMKFQMSGNWQLIGDLIKHSNIEMSGSADNQMGALISKLVNNSSKGIAGQANVYEISANRIVMVGTDGAAMEYIRQ